MPSPSGSAIARHLLERGEPPQLAPQLRTTDDTGFNVGNQRSTPSPQCTASPDQGYCR
ncbi:hypothetical protein H6G76_13520 [Nostoc sp. FACHB-152]|uniref:hypothetical protein n=1 Tax=unclassified Nostoc TaxID=2593658 RepID=UPI0016820523|nr:MULTISPECIES: hypothetical protein [unclassified Nostoc]MBD2448167.1 hypothetical protein [Nostoc sp. FACHB-152]MBD2470556.1 hypothetical protein [Nostoc sp. FACHB-145]